MGLDWPNPNCELGQITSAQVQQPGVAGDYLFEINGRFDHWDILVDVSLEGRDVDGLPHSTGHCEVRRAGERVVKEGGRETCRGVVDVILRGPR